MVFGSVRASRLWLGGALVRAQPQEQSFKDMRLMIRPETALEPAAK